MVQKIRLSIEHERRWAERLTEEAGGPPDDPSKSFHATVSPEMEVYREGSEEGEDQAEGATSPSSEGSDGSEENEEEQMA